MHLEEKSRLILEAIAKGQSYDQILAQNTAWTYRDIFAAAEEALVALNSVARASRLRVTAPSRCQSGLDSEPPHLDSPGPAQPEKTYEQRMAAIQSEHPRAYARGNPKKTNRSPVFTLPAKNQKKSPLSSTANPAPSKAASKNSTSKTIQIRAQMPKIAPRPSRRPG